MIKLLEGIKKFIKGFVKTEYEVPLKEEPETLGYDVLLAMGPTIGSITRTLGYYPISDVKFGLKSYHIEKVKIDMLSSVLSKESCKTFSKVSSVYYESSHIKEMTIKHQLFCLGIDRKVWKFDFEVYFIYKYWNNVFDDEIAELSVQYVNGIIEALRLNSMTFNNSLKATSIYDQENVKSRHFSGFVKTYGDTKDYNLFSMETTLPENEDIDSDLITKEIDTDIPIEKYIKENTLLMDVIRKQNINVSLRGE